MEGQIKNTQSNENQEQSQDITQKSQQQSENLENNENKQDQTQQNNQKPQNQDIQEDDLLDQALDDFDNKLNLTADEKDNQDDFQDPELEKEYTEFMKSLSNDQSGQDALNQFTNMFGDLLSGMAKNEGGAEGGDNKNSSDQDDIGSNPFFGLNPGKEGGENDFMTKMQSVLGNIEKSPHFEKFANNLLHEFMDKEILEEPLKEARQSYQEYLNLNKEKISQEDYSKYDNQKQCLDKLLEQLEKEPQNKEKLVEIFEKMQEYGNPPDDIVSTIGKDNPINLISSMKNNNENSNNQKNDGANPPGFGFPNFGNGANGMPGMDNPECNIF